MNRESEIHQLALQTVDALRDLGLAEHTVWSYYSSCFLPIARFCEQHGSGVYDERILGQYAEMVQARYEQGEISRSYCGNHLKTVERIIEFHNTGKLDWSCKTKISKFQLNDRFEGVLAGFLSCRAFHSNTKGDFVWSVRKYLAWLQQEGHRDVDTITVQDISSFVHYCARHLKPGSLHNVNCYVKQFHQYLDESGLLSIPYKGVLSIPVARRAQLLPALPQSELAMTMAQIDRTSEMGKRDYAIVLLGATLGLRAVDIVNMKLRDIHWRSGKIHVVQQKTGETLCLPLLPQVGAAIQEYILHGRPKSDSDYLFLRHRAPFQKMNDGVPIGDMFNSYQKKAGIVRQPYDGKGFHSLRRLLGREMTIAEVPITTIAQVLGHSKTDSATQYISLDGEHLKACALDFRGIEVGRSDLLA